MSTPLIRVCSSLTRSMLFPYPSVRSLCLASRLWVWGSICIYDSECINTDKVLFSSAKFFCPFRLTRHLLFVKYSLVSNLKVPAARGDSFLVHRVACCVSLP